MLNLRMQKLGNAVIVHCVGRVTFPDATAVQALAVQEPHAPCLVLDLQNVTAMDAAGLGALVSLQEWSKRLGKTLKLMNVAPRVQDLLELTNLKPIFHICSAKEMLDLMCRAIKATESEIEITPFRDVAILEYMSGQNGPSGQIRLRSINAS